MSDGNGMTPQKQPPSLIGGTSSAPPKPAGEEPRILAGLDSKTRRPAKGVKTQKPLQPAGGAKSSRKGVWVSLGILLLALGAGASVWHAQRDVTADSRPASQALDAADHGIVSASSEVRSGGGEGSGKPVAAPTNTTATIVNEEAPSAAPAQGPVSSITTIGPTVAGESTSQAKPPSEATKAQAVRANDATSAGKQARVVDGEHKHADKAQTRHERLAALHAERLAERERQNQARTADPDADILAALFKHTDGDEAKPLSKSHARTGADAKSGTKSGHHATPPAAGSLAAKVAACRDKGFFNGEVCRWQACNGHWGSDPACPGHQPEVSSQGVH